MLSHRPFSQLHVLAALLLLFVAGILTQIPAKEMTKVPAAVMSAFKAAYPTASIIGTSKEVEKGKTYYEIESMDGKTRRDILYNSDGTVAEIEEQLARASDLPLAVADSLKGKYPDFAVQKAEKITRGDTTAYEVTIKKGKSTKELLFAGDGSLMNKGTKAGERREKEERESGRTGH